jgi:predicted dinucleotide-binding enzyme
MRIGIIGAGKIGETAARLFIGAGHDVALSNSRGPSSLEPLVKSLGPKAHAMSVAEAARFGDVVLLAVPWRNPEALPPAEAVAGKIVIDAMNPYAAAGGIADLGGLTSSEHTAHRLPGARIVKAFNTIWFKHLGANARTDVPPGQRHAIPAASDDDEARRVVMQFIEDIGFGPVDNGGLKDGGPRQQPDGPLYNRPMTADEARRVLGA